MDKRIFCYRNLNRKGVVWSVKNVKTGLVVDRSPVVYLKDTQLKVSQAGRKRVLKEKHKNVHAGVQGVRLKNKPRNISNWERAKYNPYLNDSFITVDGIPVRSAQYVMLREDGLWIGGEWSWKS